MKKIFIILLSIIITSCNFSFTTEKTIPEAVMKLSQFKVLNNKAYLSISELSMDISNSLWKEFLILESKGIKDVVIHLNTPGGNVVAALPIIDALERARDKGFNITIIGRGAIMSAGIVIYVIGNTRISSKRTTFMIHGVRIIDNYGNRRPDIEEKMKDSINMANKICSDILRNYTKLTEEQIKEFIKGEKWFNADKAKEWGLVDIIE